MANLRLDQIARSLRGVSSAQFEVTIEKELGAGIHAEARENGRTIAVSEEAVRNLSDDELAWLISHEIAHLEMTHGSRFLETMVEASKRRERFLSEHYDRMVAKGRGPLARTLIYLAGSVGAGLGNAMEAGLTSQRQEDEADARAVQLTAAAGFNPEAGAEVVRKVAGGHHYRHNLRGKLFASHPDSISRAERIRSKATEIRRRRP